MVNQCGINIKQRIIDLIADKVNFLMPDGSTNAKISIDPTTGAINAVDGNFEGTIRAKNVFSCICLTNGIDADDKMNTVFLNGSDAGIMPWDEDSSDSWVFFYNDVTISDVSFEAGTYMLGSDINDMVPAGDANFWLKEDYYDQSGWRVCSGPADKILCITNGANYPSGRVYIPRASDYKGKIITITYPNYTSHNNIKVYQVDNPDYDGIQRNDFVTSVYFNNGHIAHSHTSDAIYLTVDEGKEITIYSTGARWVKIDERNLS